MSNTNTLQKLQYMLANSATTLRKVATCRSASRKPTPGFHGLAALAVDEQEAFLATVNAVIETQKIVQVDIARAIGKTPSQMSRILSGETGLDLSTAYKIAQYLGETIESLIEPTRRKREPVSKEERARRSQEDAERFVKRAAELAGVEIRITRQPKIKPAD